MKLFLMTAAVATALSAAPAFADCLADLAKADEAMKTMTLDQATTDKAKGLMSQARTAHDNGDNAVCETSAKELVTLLGIQTTQ